MRIFSTKYWGDLNMLVLVQSPELFTHGLAAAAFPGWIEVVTWAGSAADGAMAAQMFSFGPGVVVEENDYEGGGFE